MKLENPIIVGAIHYEVLQKFVNTFMNEVSGGGKYDLTKVEEHLRKSKGLYIVIN